MGRIVSFLVVVVILVVKYFVFRYWDEKKIDEEVEKSKSVWVESFKTEYLANCEKDGEGIDPNLDFKIYCACMAEKAQQAAAFPTAYNADKLTAEQYQQELTRLSDTYFNSDLGKKNIDDCLIAAEKR